MFSPVGNHPPSVYWRRRIIVLGSAVLLLLLIVLTIRVASGGDGGSTDAAANTSSSSVRPPSNSSTAKSTSAAASSSVTSKSRSASTSGSKTTTSNRPVAPARCVLRSLAVQAAVGKTAYKVGAEPIVALQVTNTGSRPCIQDLADKQIVLKVYNGESRVWGSHDCEIQPGTADRTLPMGQAVRVSITWSGRTSQSGCKGTRQRVGAGTYTLYAQLAGKSGKAAQFTIG